MLDGLAPDIAPRLLIAIGGVAVAFLVLIFVLLYLRRRNSHLFVKGGRAREHRLQVMDAAAIDAKRRLVLIKRDNTEHLIMIGGPTDIVIETGIGGKPVGATPANDKNEAAERALAAARAPVDGRKPAEPDKAAVAQRPITPERAPVAAIPPQRPAEQAVRPATAVLADAGRRVKVAPANDADRSQRRMQRQAARALDAGDAVTAAAVASPVSAMGAVLYGEDRERPADARPPQSSTVRDVAIADQSSAANAELELERARSRVLDAPTPAAAPATASASTDILKTLEQQLESGKVTAARAEAARLEAERAAAAKTEAARAKADADRAEAERLEAVRLEAQKAEAIRLEAGRAEQVRQEALRAENARLQAERDENAQAEAARAEADRLAAARAEAMARFEAARRAQAEQRLAAQAPAPEPEQPPVRSAQWPIAEPPVAEPALAALPEPVSQQISPVSAYAEESEPVLNSGNQERLASDFEKLLEAELEADGVLDNYPAPSVQIPVTGADRLEPGFGAPMVNPVQRDSQPITGAAPGISIEQDMARRLGEISLNKKPDTP